MFRVILAGALGLTLVLSGCGNSSSTGSSNISGNWSATLTHTDGTPAFGFTTTFTQMSGNDVNVANLTFTTSTPCFVSGETETASFILSGNFSGSVTGAFQLTIASGNPSGDTLTLQGTVKNNSIVGKWTLVGLNSGCSGTGNFVVTKM
jgi:hypothetical protein